MHSSPQRVAPCPRPGCPEWAVIATRHQIDLGQHIWRCGADHHGPRILGPDHDDPRTSP